MTGGYVLNITLPSVILGDPDVHPTAPGASSVSPGMDHSDAERWFHVSQWREPLKGVFPTVAALSTGSSGEDFHFQTHFNMCAAHCNANLLAGVEDIFVSLIYHAFTHFSVLLLYYYFYIIRLF